MTASLSPPVTESPPDPASISPSPPRTRLEFLDGIRGIAALCVVFSHCIGIVDRTGVSLAPIFLTGLVEIARVAVAVFIVLSGYCLMLPVALASNNGNDPDTWRGFLLFVRRRARRILPPYYAALAAALVLETIVPWRPAFTGCAETATRGGLGPGVILSHLFLVHNFSASWINRIDPPMWSIATEWQIYFLFPLILLPIHRRIGAMAAIISGIAIGLLPVFLFHRFEWGAPWFLGLFAMGMAAAARYPGARADQRDQTHAWGWAALGLLAVLFAIILRDDCLPFPNNWKHTFCYDLVSAGFITSFLIWAGARAFREHCRQIRRKSIVLRILASRIPMKLGSFSYSLYLIHAPTILLLTFLLPFVHLPLRPNFLAIVVVLVAISLSVTIAFAFHLVFEKPFQRSQKARN